MLPAPGPTLPEGKQQLGPGPEVSKENWEFSPQNHHGFLDQRLLGNFHPQKLKRMKTKKRIPSIDLRYIFL